VSLKLVSIVGARPQFVKAAMVSRALRAHGVEEVLVHTGQHYDDDMSAIFFSELRIPAPKHQLGIGGGPHGAMTGRMLAAIEEVLEAERPDRVVVFGDTNSTLAGALAAVKLHLPVAHVEAGLRSFNRHMPEEINRVLTDHIADLLFAPTELAVENLRHEGRPAEAIHMVGDVMFDACLHYGAHARPAIIERLGLRPRHYVLATVHRAENTDDVGRLRAIVAGLAMVAAECPVVWPLHPRTRTALARANLMPTAPWLTLTDPVGFLDMIALEKDAVLIATDSGGVQKEAFFHRVPCLTLRDETEWSELVRVGWNRLVPPRDAEAVRAAVMGALARPPPDDAPNLYGEGHTAAAIAAAIMTTAR